MQRRQFLVSTAALALAGCTGTTAETIGTIIAALQTTCGFTTTIDMVVRVLAGLASGFDPVAGAATVVATDIAKQAVDLICNAVKAEVATHATLKSAAKGQASQIVVKVHTPNGGDVDVSGIYVAK